MFVLFWFALGLGAAEELAELRHIAAVNKNLEGYSAVCHYLYETEEHPDLLLAYADSIHQLGLRTGMPEAFIEYHAWTGEACFIQGDYDGGFAWKRKAMALAEKYGKLEYLVDYASDMGYYNNVAARYDSARYYFRKGMEMAEEHPELAGHYRTMLTNYASSFLLEGKTDSALVYTHRAELRSVADRDTALWIENLNQLGTLYRRKKELEKCIQNFEKALKLCEAQGNFRTAAHIYGNIATAYADWNRPADALPFSKKALEYARTYGTPQLVGILYVNLGVIQCNMEESQEEGIATLNEAVRILKEVNNKRRLCEAYNHLTNAYRRLGKMNQATSCLQKLDSLSGELQTEVERYRYYQAKALLLQEKGQYAEAVRYYRRQMALLENEAYHDPKDYECYLHAAECYAKLQDGDAAYAALVRAYSLRDSAFNTAYTAELAEYQAKYQTKEKELEISRLLQQELERKSEYLHHRALFGMVFFLLVTVVWGLLYARQRQRARLAQLARDVGEKERRFLSLQKETELRLARKYIDGLESERGRMAAELHDDVCNALLALAMNLHRLSEEEKSGERKADMHSQLVLLDNICKRLRTLSHELMPPAFQYATIDEMLSDYLTHLELPPAVQARYHSSPEGMDWSQIPQPVAFEVYRIVQESVSNAVRHASASEIEVELSLQEHRLSIAVTDNGKGFDTERRTKGIGLRTLRQRIESIGGALRISSSGQGTRVEVVVNI